MLLVCLILYNNPLELIPGQKIQFEVIGSIAESIFISVLLYFWLILFQESKRIKITKRLRNLINVQKILLILLYSLPLAITKIAYLFVYSELELNNRAQLPYYRAGQTIKQCALGIYAIQFIYLSIRYLRSSKRSRGLAVEGNHNFLCKLSIAIFLLYSVIVTREYFVPDEANTFSVYGTRALFNVYVYIITYLYLPVESNQQEEEQQYELGTQHNRKKKKASGLQNPSSAKSGGTEGAPQQVHKA